MPEIDIIKAELSKAQRGINTAINAVNEWEKATVEGVAHTAGQRDALIDTFDLSIAEAEAAIAAAKAERQT